MSGLNKTERKLTITIVDNRPDGDRNGREPRRSRSYTDYRKYLRDMGRLMNMRGVRLRETTESTVEIHPIAEAELFD